MKYIYIIFFCFITLSCKEDEGCFSILIIDKKILNNKYYLPATTIPSIIIVGELVEYSNSKSLARVMF